jgi:hypothetical protein
MYAYCTDCGASPGFWAGAVPRLDYGYILMNAQCNLLIMNYDQFDDGY